MNSTAKQLTLAVVFLAAVGVAVAYVRFPAWFGRTVAEKRDLGQEQALERYGFHLKDVAQGAGLTFVHQTPTLDPKVFGHIMPLVVAMGAGVSVVDFDRDGRQDLFVVNSGEGSRCALYRNKGDGTFEDVAGTVGLAELNAPGTGVCMGAVWGDFDNDGYEDVLVYKWGRPELFRNLGGKSFERMTEKAGLPKWLNANAALWLDYDRDGKLDLFLAGYWRDDLDLWNLKTTRVMPESFEYATNGGRKYLLRNKGDGTFEDVTEKVGLRSQRWTLGAVAADLCGTGYPDIVLANDYGVSEFLCNKKGEKFEEIGKDTGIGVKPKSGMNASLGDIYNRGQQSIYISNISEPGNLVQGNNLWVPQPEEGPHPRYLDLGADLKVALGGWSWGAQFGDLNNDGNLDLYLTNGYVSADRTQSYWYAYSKIAGSLDGLIVDASKWPAMGNKSLSGFQQKCLWVNKGGEFVDVAPAVGVTDQLDGRAVVLADLGNRGVLDVVVANQKGPMLLYRNAVAPGRNWVQFELEGTASNRSAIGAAVTVFWKNGEGKKTRRQVQVVSGGDGYAAQSPRRLHFGLGADATVEKVIIRWPSGLTQTVEGPKVDTLHRLTEPRQ